MHEILLIFIFDMAPQKSNAVVGCTFKIKEKKVNIFFYFHMNFIFILYFKKIHIYRIGFVYLRVCTKNDIMIYIGWHKWKKNHTYTCIWRNNIRLPSLILFFKSLMRYCGPTKKLLLRFKCAGIKSFIIRCQSKY